MKWKLVNCLDMYGGDYGNRSNSVCEPSSWLFKRWPRNLSRFKLLLVKEEKRENVNFTWSYVDDDGKKGRDVKTYS